VEVGVATAEMTRDACAFVGLADLARLAESFSWDEPESLCGLEFFCVSKLDFRRPYCATNVDPVVAGGSLEWFSGADRLANRLLSFSIQLDGVGN
jgi:hypothetical protein